MDVIQHIITNPAYYPFFSTLKGARNALVYGAKVRFSHAVVMAILFRRGSWKKRLIEILTSTKSHALNLAKYATIYKGLVFLQARLHGGKEGGLDAFFAGLIGGFAIFGRRTAVNEQIVLYVCSRVLASYLPRARPAPAYASLADVKPIPPDDRAFTIFAAVCWGIIAHRYRHNGETIQPGLFHSCTYMYRDSDRWKDLRTLLWHNT